MRRLMCNLSRKTAYLKSETVKIGHFGAISGFFLDFPRFCRYGWRRGLTIVPEAWAGL